MSKISSFAILTLLITLCASDVPYRKVIHNLDPQAKCLDGSPGVLYIHEGGQPNKILIYFEGSGVCAGLTLNETIENCYNMSFTYQGSSQLRNETIERQDIGILSRDPTKNRFATWTKILIACCSGSFHQGYRNSPIAYKGKQLYFRGSGIVRSHLKWLLQYHSLAQADQVLVAGSSAGGVATFLWSNYIQTLVNIPQNVYTAADSNVFMRFKAYQTDIQLMTVAFANIFKVANVDEKTPLQLCNRANQGEEWKCLFFEHAFSAILPKAIVSSSEYDSLVITDFLQVKCLTQGSLGQTLTQCSPEEMDYIEGYRSKLKTYIQNFLMFSKNSAWTVGCSHHGYIFEDKFYNNDNERVPAVSGIKLNEAYESFAFKNGRIVNVQENPWPANTGCAK